ncbi:MAG: hypothetical protein DI498_14865 [Paracoccus denitrificans]|nr:MAG: hypothetical protein DI498_14865 [Paracoccus denitrificans]PZO82583.1 MAG: hypothetical protein DI633_14865 [Paracoccus denitrificans]
MSFKPGKFARHEPSRREIRDQLRTRFFEEAGVTPIADVLLRDVDLEAQAQLVSELLEVARAAHQDDSSALDQLKAEMGHLQFGSSAVYCSKRTAPNLKGLSLGSLSQTFFYTYRW